MTAPSIVFAHRILPVGRPPLTNGFMTVENGRIRDTGLIADLPDLPEKAAFLENSPQKTIILTPGLVNTHCHLEQSFGSRVEKSPKQSSKQSMSDWLRRVTERNRQFATPADIEARCRRGVAELIATGTTCVNDICGQNDTSLRVMDEAGLRGIVSPEFFHPAHQPVSVASVVDLYHKLAERTRSHGKIRIGLAPHTPFNVSPAAWRQVLESCNDAIIHTHIAESKDELAWVSGQPSDIDTLHRMFATQAYPPVEPAASPVAYLARYGLLNNHTIAAHLVYTSAADRQVLKKTGVRVAHCPRSNVFLQNATIEWADWVDSTIKIGLGTDGHLSTPDLDLRAEGRVVMELHGLDAAATLRMMTLDGADVMGLSDQTGSLAPGKWADYVLWEAPAGLEGLSAEAQVLHEQTRLLAVAVAGKVLRQEETILL